MIKPYYSDDYCTIYHGDSREIVPHLGRFDLLLTDPPYGIGEGDRKKVLSRHKKGPVTDYGENTWDKTRVAVEDLWIQVCSRAVVFGGNYYPLPPCVGPLVWDKLNGTCDFADGELAWNNFGTALRIFRFLWRGMIRAGEEKNKKRLHPTQKPVELMRWCILQADKAVKNRVGTILDPFAGSCTTGRAAKDLRRQCVCIEREERYCEAGARRMLQEVLSLEFA